MSWGRSCKANFSDCLTDRSFYLKNNTIFTKNNIMKDKKHWNRNAGRKSVPDGVRLNLLVPRDKVQEVKTFVKELQKEAIDKNVNI